MNFSMHGGGSIFAVIQILNLLVLLLILGASAYLTFLTIKALKIYIKKNS